MCIRILCKFFRQFFILTENQEEIDDEEDMDGFIPAPPQKKKRDRTLPGQSKLDFSHLDTAKKNDSLQSLLEVIFDVFLLYLM